MSGLYGTMFIDCPCCSARLEVDRESGKLVQHWKKGAEKPKGDPLKAALEKLKTDESKLGSFFTDAAKEMKEHKQKALERFEQEHQRILSEGPVSRPPSPFDLD